MMDPPKSQKQAAYSGSLFFDLCNLGTVNLKKFGLTVPKLH